MIRCSKKEFFIYSDAVFTIGFMSYQNATSASSATAAADAFADATTILVLFRRRRRSLILQ